jgi:hypothetical protein
MTVIIDDAGIGDLLFGVVIGVYRSENKEFKYDVVDVEYFQPPKFRGKKYLEQASRVVFRLLKKLKHEADEPILICSSYIFDDVVEELREKYGDDRVQRVKVVGEPQYLTETAYLDELRNLGYEPIKEREEKRAKSFFHMMRWLKNNPSKIDYAKTGWPRLSRYRLFRSISQTR